MITTIIKALEEATQVPIKPLLTDEIEDCICYTLNPIYNDGAVQTDQLELRIITSTIAASERIKAQVLSTLVTVGDNEKIPGIKSCYQNGGGQLYDRGTKTIHVIMYLTITTKSEVIYQEQSFQY